MNPIYENTFRTSAYDVDSNNRLRINRIFDYFQDAASNDAERLGFGYGEFVPKGLLWVLSWIKIEFLSYPKFMDEVKIQTWAKRQVKLYSMRDFFLFNIGKEIICKGTSAWLLLDSKSLRPKILTRLYPDLKLLENNEALTDIPQKIIPPKEMEKIYSKKIRYSDIDLNKHTNNAKYIEFMFDCFDHEFYLEHTVKTLTVSFNAETKIGDEVEIYRGELNSNSSHYVETRNVYSGNLVFQAEIDWTRAE